MGHIASNQPVTPGSQFTNHHLSVMYIVTGNTIHSQVQNISEKIFLLIFCFSFNIEDILHFYKIYFKQVMQWSFLLIHMN